MFSLVNKIESLDDELHDDEEGFIGTRAYHRNTTGRK